MVQRPSEATLTGSATECRTKADFNKNTPDDFTGCSGKGLHLDFTDLWIDIKGGIVVGLFTILAPVLAMGWPFFSFKGIALYMIMYFVTQNLPNLFQVSLFESCMCSRLFGQLGQVSKPFKMIKTFDSLDPSKTYVIGWHPHGRLFIGTGILVGSLYRWFPEMKASARHIFVGINDAMFRIPLLGTWFYMLGMVPVNKHSMRKVLSLGNSVCIVVGGIEEVLLGTYEDKDILYVKKRKGFVKIAMESGSGLIPVFCFGENQLFYHSSHQILEFWSKINAYVKLGAPFPIWGRWGFPIMLRRPMLVVFGKPLFANEGESLDQFHARYIESLEALHAAHVGLTENPKRRLVIV